MAVVEQARLFDLADVAESVGEGSFKRGLAYANAGRVMSIRWDRESHALRGRVVGHGQIYNSAVFMEERSGRLELLDSECSCPVGYGCKHTVALMIAALDANDALPSVSEAEIASAHKLLRAAGAAHREQATTTPARTPEWERSLRAMIPVPADSVVGTALAIELTVVIRPGTGGAQVPRLKARLMRTGARGGWVNGSLSWGSLESWRVRSQGLREDHVALARRLFALDQRGSDGGYRYYSYGYRDERTVDITDWDAELWTLLEQAQRSGLPLIHAQHKLGEIPRVREGELVLDVTLTPGGDAQITPTLRLRVGSLLAGYEPLLFLGAPAAHGLVMVQSGSTQDESAGSAGPTSRPLRLVRLVREAPVELQQMVLAGTVLRVPHEQLPRLCTELAPAVRKIAPVISSDDSIELPEVSEPRLVLRARYGESHMTQAQWGWAYTVGERPLEFALEAGGEGAGLRDLDAEQAIIDRIDLHASGLDALGLLDADGRPARARALIAGFDTVTFATQTVPALARQSGVTLQLSGEPLDYRSVDESLEIGVATVEIDGERDWFDLNVTITVDGRELPFAEVFAALARGERQMLLDDGAYFSLRSPQLESLRELIEEARTLGDGSRPGALRISRYQAGFWQELVALGVVREQAESWRRQVEAVLALDELDHHELPAGLRATLRPYQRDGFEWLATLWELGLGGILADDMGLGKTLQALALICYVRQAEAAAGADERWRADGDGGDGDGGAGGGGDGRAGGGGDGRAGGERSAAPGEPCRRPFLVIAPTSVVPGWVAEAERFAPGLRVRALADTLRRAHVKLGDLAREADVVLSTYTLVRLDEDRYGAVEWAGVILDEAQAVKNRNAKTHAAIRRLDAPFKLAITGTPMENNLGELWSILSIAAPGLFPDPVAFSEHYAKPIERHGDGERLARLRRRIKPLVKRRTKELVAADLPPKQEQVLQVELHARHRRLYDTYMQRERERLLGLLEDFDSNRFTILTALTRMRQLSLHAGLIDQRHANVPSAKLDALAHELEDVIGGGHRALVFSQFTGFLALVRERLDAARIEHCYLDGRTRQRDKVITRFKQGDAPVFLISLKAGGFGLNLTEADYCFLLDPWWNPAVETQAIDRTHRIGQTRQVMVYRLVSKGTIEQKVVALAQRKAALFKGVMDAGEMFASALTAEDIRGLLA